MPAIDWPESILPLPSQNYSSQHESNLVRNEFEVADRQRPKYGFNSDTVSVIWEFDQFQRDVFRAFVKDVLNNGSDKFNITLLGLDGLRKVNEVILVGGNYTESYFGHLYYRVSATLKITNAPEFDDAGFLAFIASLPDFDAQTFYNLGFGLYDYLEFHYGFPDDYNPKI